VLIVEKFCPYYNESNKVLLILGQTAILKTMQISQIVYLGKGFELTLL